jgi:peptidoglycan-associated lipoprotein
MGSMMENRENRRISRLALLSISAFLIIAGCAGVKPYRSQLDRMRAELADAKAAGAEKLAPEEYARAEACLDWWTHYVTQFDHIGDATTANLPARCAADLQALKSRMVAVTMVPTAPPPVPPPPVALAPVAPPPPVDGGIYPRWGPWERPPQPVEEPPLVVAEAPPPPPVEPTPAPPVVEAPPAPPVPPASAVDEGIYPKWGPWEPPPPPPVKPAPAAPVVAVAPPAPTPPPVAVVPPPEKEKEPPLEDIFFDYDQAAIRPDAQKSLDKNARWLRENPGLALLIEGHCDERGTHEYNLGLGQRRAQATQDYLVASGVDVNRIKIISYGKERPFVIGHDESAWQWNRRAHFVLQ